MNAAPAYSRGAVALLLALLALAWFSTLDYRKLIKPDEGRYAEIAREMALSGDWVTPRLNGIKYFEKPPLQYWATAASFRLFGPDEWTARLWSALTGFAGVLLAWYAGKRLWGPTAGVLSAMVLGTSLWYLVIGHLNTLDMGVTFFLEAAMCAFVFAQRSAHRSTGERRWMLAAWAAMALAVLSKGLAGLVLPAATLIAYCTLQRTLAPFGRMHFGKGLLVFLALAAPWFIAVSKANPEFAHFFFVHEHFERYLTREHGRYEPFWYFVPVLLLGLLPWTTMALQAGAAGWRSGASSGFNERRFLVLWAAVIFLFFSASGSKLPSYILPVFPAIALLAGDWLASSERASLRWHLAFVGIVSIIAFVVLQRMTTNSNADPMTLRYAQWLMGAFVLLGAGTLGALWLRHRGRTLTAIATLATSALIAGQVALLGHEALGRSFSAHYIAGQIRPLLTTGVPFYSVGMYEQTLPFYIERTVTLVEYGDEFTFGQQQEPQLALPTMAAFRQRWLEDDDAFAMFSQDGWKLMQRDPLPMEIVAEDERRIVVRKPQGKLAPRAPS